MKWKITAAAIALLVINIGIFDVLGWTTRISFNTPEHSFFVEAKEGRCLVGRVTPYRGPFPIRVTEPRENYIPYYHVGNEDTWSTFHTHCRKRQDWDFSRVLDRLEYIDYRGVEFPWLALLLLPAGLCLTRSKRKEPGLPRPGTEDGEKQK